VVAITGQVARQFIGKDAFQEVDITGITLPITKHNYLVTRAKDVAGTVKNAFHIAKEGRPSPVLIDVPRDVFIEEAEFQYPDKTNLRSHKPTLEGHPSQVKKAARLINEAKRPLIIAGRGVLISGASPDLKELAEKGQLPVVTTLLGIGSFPQSHVLSFGMLGMHGMACANIAVDAADLIVAIGMRFDDRATARVSGFAPNAQIIHVDIDAAEVGKNVRVDVPIVGDVAHVLRALNEQVTPQNRVDWLSRIEEWKRDHPSLAIRETGSLLPQYVVSQICEITQGNAIVVSDVGQNQMWAATHFQYERPNTLISAGGLGPMGFALPAAVGAKVACPDETVWCIAGDGGFQMNIQELGTITQENLAVKIAVLNNGFLGMVRQWQQLFYQRRYVATPLSNPDFVKVAEAYGIAAIRVTDKLQVVPAIQQAMEHQGPFFIDFVVEPEENVYPMVPPGAALAEIMEEPREEVRAR
jgi:acetolactate synthase-1/2/3 large subunit